jgi:predicted small integral membrane protein
VNSRGAARGPETIRLLKAVLVLAVGSWALVIAFDNVVDYDGNWQFVRHVLAMDTVFPGNTLKYRAITSEPLQTLGYWLIIATEWTMGALCMAGAARLFAARRERRRYIAAKPLAAAGLVLVFLLYYVGFVIVGGEWFCMWQSPIWNGQQKAFMFLGAAMLVLIVLLMREDDDGA